MAPAVERSLICLSFAVRFIFFFLQCFFCFRKTTCFSFVMCISNAIGYGLFVFCFFFWTNFGAITLKGPFLSGKSRFCLNHRISLFSKSCSLQITQQKHLFQVVTCQIKFNEFRLKWKKKTIHFYSHSIIIDIFRPKHV